MCQYLMYHILTELVSIFICDLTINAAWGGATFTARQDLKAPPSKWSDVDFYFSVKINILVMVGPSLAGLNGCD